MNLPLGDVEAVILGNEANILIMIQHSYLGPQYATVDHIEQNQLQDFPHYYAFKMIR